MILYDLSNPSDAYTFEAPDRATAVCVVALFGSHYGASAVGAEDKALDVPICLFGGMVEMVCEALDCAEDQIDAQLTARAETVAKSLESFCCGGRDGFDALTIEERAAQNEERRSSMNDIGKRAHSYAEWLRERIAASAA